MRDGVKDWLEENDDWLMVIDNADSYNDLFESGNSLSDDTIKTALPLQRPGSAMILYTSRHARVGTELTESHCLPLGVLSRVDSKNLLRCKLGISVDDEQVHELLEALDYLPMSICHAAAYLTFTKMSINDYLSRIREDEGLLEVLDQTVVDVGRRDAKAPRSVVKAWLATYDLIMKHNELAAHLFCFMACLDRQSISENIILTAASDEMEIARLESSLLADGDLIIQLPKPSTGIEVALGELESLALITRDLGGRLFTMHRFVQAITIQRLSTNGSLNAFSAFSACCLAEVFLADVSDILVRCEDGYLENAQQYVPTAERLQQMMEKLPYQQERSGRPFILTKLGIYFYARGDFRKASKCFANATFNLDPEWEEDYEARIVIMQIICLSELGEYPEARTLASKLDIDLEYTPMSDVTTMEDLLMRGCYGQLAQLARKLIEQPVTEWTLQMRALGRAYLAIAITCEESHANSGEQFDILISQAEEDFGRIEDSLREYMPKHLTDSVLALAHFMADNMDTAERLADSAIKDAIDRFGQDSAATFRPRALVVQLRMCRFEADLDSILLEQICEVESESRAMYSQMLCGRSLAQRGAKDLSAADDLAHAIMLKVRKGLMECNGDTDSAFADRGVDIEEAEELLISVLAQADQCFGALSACTLIYMSRLYECLTLVGRRSQLCAFVHERATLMADSMSRGGLSDAELDLTGDKGMVEWFLEYGNVHWLCVKMLCADLSQRKTQQSPDELVRSKEEMWQTIKRIQTRQFVVDAYKQSLAAPARVVHQATCDQCDEVIRSLASKLLTRGANNGRLLWASVTSACNAQTTMYVQHV